MAEADPTGASKDRVSGECTRHHASSVNRALEMVRLWSREQPDQPVEVLVTGSLYLVGNVMHALGAPSISPQAQEP